jgi:hypothetical protein
MPPGGCNVDGDCGADQWCAIALHTCKPKLDNGTGMPTDSAHGATTLDGTCSAAAGAIVCKSGVCDTNDNLCGYATGDGPCTGTSGASVCRSTLCATTGPQSGTCVSCLADTDCSGSTPACDTSKNACVECTPQNDSHCSGTRPVCDAGSKLCTVCGGDFGSTSSTACKGAAPYCFTSGASTGECGKCATDADCTGHPGGPTCDTTSGACKIACHTDADCSATE